MPLTSSPQRRTPAFGGAVGAGGKNDVDDGDGASLVFRVDEEAHAATVVYQWRCIHGGAAAAATAAERKQRQTIFLFSLSMLVLWTRSRLDRTTEKALSLLSSRIFLSQSHPRPSVVSISPWKIAERLASTWLVRRASEPARIQHSSRGLRSRVRG